jgi:hypothetical protein
MNKLDLTVVIPVHSIAGDFDKLFENALNSVERNSLKPELVLVSRCNCKDVKEFLDAYDFSKYSFDVKVVESKTSSTFQGQINNAVKNHVETELFSILEFDDQFSDSYFANILAYKAENESVGMLVPIVALYDDRGVFNGFINESVWAMNVSDVQGEITEDLLLDYPQFNLTGCAIRTDKFNSVGGFKENIKLSFTYEFLLRFARDSNKIKVIPKIGYRHMLFREGSLFWLYKNDPEWLIKSDEESRFWLDTAKKEYYFKQDRKVTYEG